LASVGKDIIEDDEGVSGFPWRLIFILPFFF
jgi:hypothetical protein